MKRGRYVTAFSIISDDLVEEIFFRVDQKTLGRCKSVCKNWKILISDQKFMERFITRLKTLPPPVNGFYYGQKIPNRLCPVYGSSSIFEDADVKFLDYPSNNKLNDKSVDTSLSFLQKKSPIVAISSHDGFILCVEKPNEKPEKALGYFQPFQFHYIICNPMTKQWVQLPQPPNSHRFNYVNLFCYNKNESNRRETEFKVVSFLLSQHRGNDVKVDTYTSETGEWKTSSVWFPKFSCGTCNVLFDGSIYIKANKKLYAYDLKDESMRSIGLPNRVRGYFIGHLGVSAGSLYYAASTDDFKLFRVWILKDGVGWSLQHEIDCGSMHTQLPGSFHITYRQNEILNYGFCLQPLAFHPLNHNVIFVNVAKLGVYERVMTILYHKDSGRVQVIDDLNHCNSTPIVPYYLPAWVPSLNNTL